MNSESDEAPFISFKVRRLLVKTILLCFLSEVFYLSVIVAITPLGASSRKPKNYLMFKFELKSTGWVGGATY
jgi:hypothetical protein